MGENRHVPSTVWIGLLALAVTACGLGEGGLGLPTQRSGETYPGARMEIAGTMAVTSNGCFELDTEAGRHFVIWPAGSALDDRVRLPDRSVVREGDRIEAVGAMTPVDPLVADRNGYWAQAIGYCAPDAMRVIVLDEARRSP